MSIHFVFVNSKSQAPWIGWHWKMVTKTEHIQSARITAAVTYTRRRKRGFGKMRRYDAMMEALVNVTAVA